MPDRFEEFHADQTVGSGKPTDRFDQFHVEKAATPTAQATTPEGPGFFQRFYENSPLPALVGIGRAFVSPKAAYDLGESGLESFKRNWEEFGRAGGSLQHGDIPGAAFHYAGAVPFVGAPAQQVARDIEAGNIHGAAGGGAGLLTSAALLGRSGGSPAAKAAPEIPPPPSTPSLLRTLATDPQLRTDVLGLVSPRMAHAVAGVKRVGRIAERVKELSNPADTPVATPPPPGMSVGVGQKVSAPPVPPPPKPGPSVGVGQKTSTPSGTVPGIQPATISGTAGVATPASSIPTLDEFAQGQGFKNFASVPDTYKGTIQDLQAKYANEAPSIPPPPSSFPSPEPANAAGFKHSARHTDLLRQFHAQGKELDLGPESPPGKTARLTPTAKAIYGVDGSALTTPQLEAIVEFVNTHKRLPVPGDVRTGIFKLTPSSPEAPVIPPPPK